MCSMKHLELQENSREKRVSVQGEEEQERVLIQDHNAAGCMRCK